MFRFLSIGLLALVVGASPASAQTDDAIARAVLALRGIPVGGVLPIGGRLFGGSIVNTTIVNGDGDPLDFTDSDFIQFTIESTRGPQRSVFCPGNRTEFEACVRANAGDLRAILFPGSLSASVGGADAAIHYSQQFLLTTAFGMTTASEGGRLRRAEIGGLFEHEWYSGGDGGGGRAWQGLYQFSDIPLSVQGRYAQQNDVINTKSTLATVDYHPSVEINPAVEWRLGATARTGVLYAHSSAMDLGSFDLGGGVWTSARKDFSRVRVGGGALLQGSKSYLPAGFAGDDFDFLAEAINDTAITWDVTYGGLVGFLASDRISLNGKVLESRSLRSDGYQPAMRLVLGSMSYLVSGRTPVDVGYKISTGGGLKVQSLFLQGNFRW
jgi:hypothetical protein